MKEGAEKIQKMMEFEINNCKKNISFYKDQMRKNQKNREFYTEQIAYMERKLERLENGNCVSLNVLPEKLQRFL